VKLFFISPGPAFQLGLPARAPGRLALLSWRASLQWQAGRSPEVLKYVQNYPRAVKKFLDAGFAISNQKGNEIKDNLFSVFCVQNSKGFHLLDNVLI